MLILTDGSDKWLAGFGALSHMESTSCVPEKVGFSVSNTVLILWETYLHYCLSTFLWCSGLQQRKPAIAKLLESFGTVLIPNLIAKVLESFGTVLIPNLGISIRSPDSTERGNTKWVCKPIFDIAYWCKWRYKQKLMDLVRCRAEFCLSSLSLMLLLWDSVCTEQNLLSSKCAKDLRTEHRVSYTYLKRPYMMWCPLRISLLPNAWRQVYDLSYCLWPETTHRLI